MAKKDSVKERTKKDSEIGKIEIDRDLCIGAASCLVAAEKMFKLDEENKAVILDPNEYNDETIKLAAKACPTLAIQLYNKKGEKIYPK